MSKETRLAQYSDGGAAYMQAIARACMSVDWVGRGSGRLPAVLWSRSLALTS